MVSILAWIAGEPPKPKGASAQGPAPVACGEGGGDGDHGSALKILPMDSLSILLLIP